MNKQQGKQQELKADDFTRVSHSKTILRKAFDEEENGSIAGVDVRLGVRVDYWSLRRVFIRSKRHVYCALE